MPGSRRFSATFVSSNIRNAGAGGHPVSAQGFPPSERVVFMRIAQIAPLFEAVPPKLYGGTERVVSALTEELVAMGHEVTLFASGDSVTAAKLDAPWPQALRLDPNIRDWVATYHLMLEYVYT